MNKAQRIQYLEKRVEHLEDQQTLVVETLTQLLHLLNPIKHQEVKLPKGVTRQGKKFRATGRDENNRPKYLGLYDSIQQAQDAIEKNKKEKSNDQPSR